MARPRAVIPRVFEVYIGGFFGPSYRISLVDGNLRYTNRADSMDDAVIGPSTEAWVQFWATLDRIHAWEWQKSYDDLDVCDGTQWEITIKVGSRRLVSSGSNAYPPKGSSNESRNFKSFCKAVSALVEGRAFE